MYRHTAGFIEHHKAVILKGNRHIETAVRFKEAVVLKSEDYDISCRNHVDTSYSNAIPRNTALLTFKLCQQTL